MKTNRKILIALSILAGVAQPRAWAHAALERAVPGKNAVLAVAPKEVSLRFNEKLEDSFSFIKVLDTDGKNVLQAKSKVDPVDPKTLRAPLESLKPGKYTVQWVGVGHDGHRRTGDYLFSVK
jgi:methionine-rich copper-binding protein CopC